MPFRFLLINPNTSAWVTEALALQVGHALGTRKNFHVDAATATLGASYIATEASYAIAGHALLDCYAANQGGHDALVVGCFGDPGLDALREVSGLPVIGMASAAMQEASRHGRFAIVTGGLAWRPMLRRLAVALGHGEHLSDIVAVAQSAGDLAKDRDKALAILEQSCRDARAGGADTIVLGGAAFAGFGDALATRTGMPIIDSVSAMARAMLALSTRSEHTPTRQPSPDIEKTAQATYTGINDPLSRLLQTGAAPKPP